MWVSNRLTVRIPGFIHTSYLWLSLWFIINSIKTLYTSYLWLSLYRFIINFFFVFHNLRGFVVSTRILVVYCFSTATVKPRLCLMVYQRNQNNLDFFAQLDLLILRGQWGWFWRRNRISGSLYPLICPLGLLYHYRVSSGLDVSHHS